MADIKAALGSSFSSYMPSKKKTAEQDTSPKRDNPATFLKIIAKNFMSIHLMARDLNVARQNSQKLVKLEGVEPAKGADAFFLKASEREKKLESEMAKGEKKPEPEKPQPKKKGFFAKLMDKFNVTNIIKSFKKYFLLAGIALIIWDFFKEAFIEWATTLWDAISEAFDEFVGTIKQWFGDVVQPIIDKVMEYIQPVIDAVKKVIDAIGNWFNEKIDWFAKTFPETFAFIKGVIDKVMVVIDAIKERLKVVTDAYNTAVDKLKSVGRGLKEGAKDLLGIKKREEVPKKEVAPPKPREVKLDERGVFVEVAPILVPSPSGVPSAPPAAPAPAPSRPEKVPAPRKDEKPLEVTGVQASIVQSLNDSGITSPKAHANVLATVKAESNFKVQSENLTYNSPERIQAVFGPRRIPSVEFAQQFVKNPEALANYVYKTTDGNSAPGDGFKYRGRGFIQHTGKNQYSAISQFTGVNVLNNPDALNSPDVAAKAIPWFLLSYKRLKPDDVENMSKVNKAIAFADPTGKKAAEREASAQQIYASMSGNPTGTQVASASSAVAAGQREQQKPTTPIVVNAPTTNNKVVNRTEVAQAPPPKDTAVALAARVA